MDAYVKGVVVGWKPDSGCTVEIYCSSSNNVVSVVMDGMVDAADEFMLNEFIGKYAEVTGDTSFNCGKIDVWAKEFTLYSRKGDEDKLFSCSMKD